MSLTRTEWEEMWEDIKQMEKYCINSLSDMKRFYLLVRIDKIKDKIQSVIGQMEIRK